MTKKKPSTIFEGKNSSLRKTYEKAVATPTHNVQRKDRNIWDTQCKLCKNWFTKRGLVHHKCRKLNKKTAKQQRILWMVNKLDSEIMDWFYECVKINFGTTMIQDSTNLREILESNLKIF